MAKRRLSNSKKSFNGLEIEKKKSVSLQIPAKGEIVWANVRPLTWLPGIIESFNGTRIQISLFGSKNTRSFDPSEILLFEESYSRVLKSLRYNPSPETDLALNHLSNNTSIGLKCFCRSSHLDEDESSAIKSRLNPREIVTFLHNKAVFPQVDEGELATVVRVSAALNAFRHDLVIFRTSEVDEGVCAEGILDIVLDAAVNHRVESKAVALLSSFRRFVSTKPDWIYQRDCELEDGSNEEEIDDQESSDCMSEDELYSINYDNSEHDGSIEANEEYGFRGADHKQDAMEICVINMMDFSQFDDDIQPMENADPRQPVAKTARSNSNHEKMPQLSKHSRKSLPFDDSNKKAADVSRAYGSIEQDISTLDGNSNHKFHSELRSLFAKDDNHESVIYDQAPKSGRQNPNDEKMSHSSQFHLTSSFDANEITANLICVSKNIKPDTSPLNINHDHNKLLENTSLPVSRNEGSPVLDTAYMSKLESQVHFNGGNAAQSIRSIPEMAPFAESGLLISSHKRKKYESTHSIRANGGGSWRPRNGYGRVHDTSSSRPISSSHLDYKRKPGHRHESNNNHEYVIYDRAAESGRQNLNHEKMSHSSQCHVTSSLDANDYAGNVICISTQIRNINHDHNKLQENPSLPFVTDEGNPVLDAADMFKPGSEVHFNGGNTTQNILPIHEMAPFAESDLQISSCKRKNYESAHSFRANGGGSRRPRKGYGGVHDMSSSQPISSGYKLKPSHRHESNWKAYYISPLMKNGVPPAIIASKFLANDKNCENSAILLNMKFPKDYPQPSKEELEKKFSVFGPLDRSRTRIFFYTGVGQVVFLRKLDAVVAYKYVTRKKIFGEAQVRFWFYKHENCRKESSDMPKSVHSSLNLKPCLKNSFKPQLIDTRKKCTVRFVA